MYTVCETLMRQAAESGFHHFLRGTYYAKRLTPAGVSVAILGTHPLTH